jgi:hypothetical protein
VSNFVVVQKIDTCSHAQKNSSPTTSFNWFS